MYFCEKLQIQLDNTDGNYNKKEIWVLDTVGTNLLANFSILIILMLIIQ